MAVIKYETADGPVEYSAPRSDIAYEAETDHWRVKAGEKDGRDVFEIIPRERVFSVKVVGNKSNLSIVPTK